jgi:uncharacterized protein YgiB involved in biofilm formation
MSAPLAPDGATLMGFDAEAMVARLANTFAKNKAVLAHYVSGLVEARRQRLEHDRKFYRNLNAYCRANNLSPICADDWKTAAHDEADNNPSNFHSKGTVS